LGALALKVGGGSGSPAQCWPCCAGGQQRACGSPSSSSRRKQERDELFPDQV